MNKLVNKDREQARERGEDLMHNNFFLQINMMNILTLNKIMLDILDEYFF